MFVMANDEVMAVNFLALCNYVEQNFSDGVPSELQDTILQAFQGLLKLSNAQMFMSSSDRPSPATTIYNYFFNPRDFNIGAAMIALGKGDEQTSSLGS